jgi:DNA-binding protein HU-beta
MRGVFMVNKQDIINLLSEKAFINKEEATNVVDKVFDIMLEELNKGEEVKIVGFGKFVVKDRASRKVVNPASKDMMTLPAQKAITFRAAKQAKDLINK